MLYVNPNTAIFSPVPKRQYWGVDCSALWGVAKPLPQVAIASCVYSRMLYPWSKLEPVNPVVIKQFLVTQKYCVRSFLCGFEFLVDQQESS